MKKISITAAVLEKNNSDLVIKNIFHKNTFYQVTKYWLSYFIVEFVGSQIGEIRGVKGKDKYLPHLLGHEATGKVLKVSRHEKEFKKTTV